MMLRMGLKEVFVVVENEIKEESDVSDEDGSPQDKVRSQVS